MKIHEWLTTQGKWYKWIENGTKTFDARIGHRDVKVGDMIDFVEADEEGNTTGKRCRMQVVLVVHTEELPKHFGWNGYISTIIQIKKEE